jgi:hypothetical protein
MADTMVSVPINTAGIDQAFMAAFMEAKLGRAIGDEIDKVLKQSWSGDSIIRKAVEQAIRDACSTIASKLIEEHKAKLEEMARAKFTDEMMQKVIDDGFAKLLRNY